MPNYANNMHSLDDMKEPIELLKKISTALLFQIAMNSDSTQDTIIGNFIARGMVCLEAITAIASTGNSIDGWILFRTLLDRLVHLNSLAENKEFEKFEAWSFYKGMMLRNDLKSDEEFGGAVKLPGWQVDDDSVRRFKEMEGNPPKWRRPKAKEVLAKMELPFLYKWGYDYASKIVHPMADDGQIDFGRLTKLNTLVDDDESIVLVNNSFLVQTILIQDGVNASGLMWMRVVYNFIDALREFLKNGSQEYLLVYKKISALLINDMPLAKLASTSTQ